MAGESNRVNLFSAVDDPLSRSIIAMDNRIDHDPYVIEFLRTHRTEERGEAFILQRTTTNPADLGTRLTIGAMAKMAPCDLRGRDGW
jgi:hypothetical protein